MGFFPNLKKKKGLIYLKNPTDVVKYLSKPVSPVVMIVGAIRALGFFFYKYTMNNCFLNILFLYSISLTRHDWRTYALYHSFGRFENPLQTIISIRTTVTFSFATFVSRNDSEYMQCPNDYYEALILFIYQQSTPRVTHLLQMATSHGWFVIDGIQVKTHSTHRFLDIQSFFFQSMIEERLAQQRMWFTSTPTLEAGSAVDAFDPEVEASARDLCEKLKPSRRQGIEIDRARKKHWNQLEVLKKFF